MELTTQIKSALAAAGITKRTAQMVFLAFVDQLYDLVTEDHERDGSSVDSILAATMSADDFDEIREECSEEDAGRVRDAAIARAEAAEKALASLVPQLRILSNALGARRFGRKWGLAAAAQRKGKLVFASTCAAVTAPRSTTGRRIPRRLQRPAHASRA